MRQDQRGPAVEVEQIDFLGQVVLAAKGTGPPMIAEARGWPIGCEHFSLVDGPSKGGQGGIDFAWSAGDAARGEAAVASAVAVAESEAAPGAVEAAENAAGDAKAPSPTREAASIPQEG